MPNAFNAVNRGVYIADNLAFLRALNDECIDLVCIDPPFAKNETFTGDRIRPPLTDSELAIERRLLSSWGINTAQEADAKGLTWPEGITRGGYTDIWSWEADIHEDWIESLETDYPAIYSLIDATRIVHSDGMAAYLCYMAIRLIEIHRVLKPTGSLYLHCDHTADSYLHLLLDAIFGEDKSRDKIVWRRTSAHNDARRFGNVIDFIQFYSGKDNINTDAVRVPLSQEYVRRFYRYQDERGRYRVGDLTGAETSRGESGQPWKGHIPARSGRHWAIPLTGNYADWIEANVIPGYKSIEGVIARLNALDAAGLIHHPEEGGVPGLKRYLDANLGQVPGNLWDDIKPIGSRAIERTGYPTQKPVALAERIIQASTNEGDVVLDCFAGCAYAGVAAERLNRRWVACDFNPRAWTVFKRQFNKPRLIVLDCEDEVTGQAALTKDKTVTVHGPDELPVRATPIVDAAPKEFALPEREFKVPASDIPNAVMLETLLEWSGYMAWCCGFANRRPDGSVVETTNNFHLDHVDPKSKRGSNQIWNRAPLCPTHNIRKGNQRIHLADYRVQIADAGEMLVDTMGALVDLAEMEDRAHRFHMDYLFRRGYQPSMDD